MPTTTLESQITDLAQNVQTIKDAHDALALKLHDDGDLAKMPDALAQLENQFADMQTDLEQRLAKVRRTAGLGASDAQYRGHFASEDQARAFGAMIVATMAGKSIPNPNVEPAAKRCRELLAADYPDLAAKAMDSTTDGALIPPEFSSRLIRLVEQFGVFEADAFSMPMGSESMTFMRRTGGMTVYVVGEGDAPTASDPSYGNVTLTPKELATLSYIPLTLEEDALPAVGELVAQEIAQAFAEASDDDGFNGDATSTYHGYFGVIPKLKDINGVDDGGGLVLGAGNAWSELTEANVLKLIGQVTYADQLRFYCSRQFFWQVLAKLVLASGGTTMGEATAGPSFQAYGVPTRFCQKLPTSEANSQVALLCGDLRRSSTVGQRRMISVDSDRSYKFAERQVSILGHRRLAINNHDLGTATAAGPVCGLITASG